MGDCTLFHSQDLHHYIFCMARGGREEGPVRDKGERRNENRKGV